MSLLDTFPELATASRSPHVALTASPSLIEAAPGALGFGGTSSSSSRVVASPLPRDAASPLQRDVAVVPHRGAGRPAGTCGWVQDLKRLKANNPETPQPRRGRPPKPRNDVPHVEPSRALLVPVSERHDEMARINPARNLADNAKIQEAFSIVDASTLQRMKGTDPDTESQLLDHVQRFSSSLVLAHLVDASRRTMKKKRSLLAFILIVYKRVMNQLAMLGLDQAMSRQVGRDRIKPL